MAATIRIAILANAARAKAEMKSVTQEAGRFSSALKGGVVAGAAAAGVALGVLAKDAIAGARESAQIHRVLESQIRNMGGAAKVAFKDATSFAEDFGQKIGKDDDDILKVINKLSTFPAAFGKGTLGAEAMRRATQAAFDLEAAGIGSAESNIIGIGKALDNPIKGMSALSKSGVSFTDIQKEQIKNYVKAGDIASAQKVLLAGIETNAKGAAAQQADGLTRAKVALDGFAETLATKALPFLDKFGNWFAGDGIRLLTQGFNAAKVALSTFIAVASNPVFQTFAAGILAVVVAMKIYSTTLAVIRAATAAYAAVQAALNVVLAANPIGIIILAIIGLVAAIVVAYKRSETFRRIVQGAFRAVTTAASAAWNWIKSHWPLILAIITGPIGLAVRFVVKHFDTIKQKIRSIPQTIRNAFSNANTLLINAGRNIISGLWNGLKQKWEDVKAWFGSITKQIPDLKGPASKDKRLLLKNGRLVMGGFQIGLESVYGNVKRSLRRFTKGVADRRDFKVLRDALTRGVTALVKKVQAQKKVVADLKKARDDYARTVADNLKSGGITTIDLLARDRGAQKGFLVQGLQNRLAAIKKFQRDILALRKRGLSADVIRQIADSGLETGANYLNALRDATPSFIQQVNGLNAAINRTANATGLSAANAVFGARIENANKLIVEQQLTLRLETGGNKWDQMLVEAIRKAVRANGGNVQVVLGRG